MTTKSLFLSLFAAFLCLIVSIICTCVLGFNLVSMLLLAAVVVTTIIASVIAWRMAVIANRNN